MARGTLGTKFTIVLYDLPLDKANLLSNAAPALKTVRIQLGYFETNVQPVMEGIYVKVESKTGADKTSGQDKLVTTITGMEAALKACSETKYTASLSDEDASSFAKAAQSVLSSIFSADNKKAGFDKLVNEKVQFNTPVTVAPLSKSDTKFNNDTVLTVLAEIAKKAKLELLVVDKMVILGSPIARLIAAAELDPSTNLAKIEMIKQPLEPKAADAKKPNSSKGTTVNIFSFTALGDPTMRPGQPIIVRGIEESLVKGIKEIAATTGFVIRSVEHQFNSSTGYVCAGSAASGLKDGAAALDIDNAIKSAATGAQDVASAIKSEAAKNPVVEVTSVKALADAYQVDLYHGQPREDEQQPSIEVAIEQQKDHVYQHRPIASPFAWRKCGLVTPVYPGMKALVAHNAGLATDGIVTGYIWSKQPDFAPPSNQAGDWWLCLPIDFDATKPPSDGTKAVNDLTGRTGKRVIEVKGLRITVGASKLANIGTRPTEAADNEFLIEHASGTSVHINSNGALTIDARKASLTVKGDVVIEGSLEIK